MKDKRFLKQGLLTVVVLLSLVLTGCVSTTDNPNGGKQNNLPTDEAPFKVLGSTQTPTAEPPTNILQIITPLPNPTDSTQILPWAQNSGQTGVQPGTTDSAGMVVPTSTGMAVITNVPTSTPVPTSTVYVIKKGSTGDDVRKLQSQLIKLGYLSGSADGDFGTATESALKAFQRRNGLTVDGIAGRATLNVIYSSKAKAAAPTSTPTPRATATPKISQNLYLRLGDSGRDVTKMQERLIELGYLSGKATGQFDATTEKGVYAFQRRNVSYADGVAGPLTLQALYSSRAKGTSTSQGVIGASLRLGVYSSDLVRNMQARLKVLGYYKGSTDGDFGPSTEAAVKAFQQNNNLTADGVAGQATLSVLYSDGARSASYSPQHTGSKVTPIPKPTEVTQYRNVTPAPDGTYITLRQGDSGSEVRKLQQALKDQGYLTGSVDGKYGAATVDAVIRFQQNKGLSQDGIAGFATQRVLFEGDYPIGS